jgi:hypothetical protein
MCVRDQPTLGVRLVMYVWERDQRTLGVRLVIYVCERPANARCETGNVCVGETSER